MAPSSFLIGGNPLTRWFFALPGGQAGDIGNPRNPLIEIGPNTVYLHPKLVYLALHVKDPRGAPAPSDWMILTDSSVLSTPTLEMKENDRHAHQGRPGPIPPTRTSRSTTAGIRIFRMAVWVKPGDDFVLKPGDWTGGAIKNDDSADDVRDVDPVHRALPVRRWAWRAPNPATCWWWTCWTSAPARQPVGLQRLLQPQQWRRLPDRSFSARAEIHLGISTACSRPRATFRA